MMVEEPLIIPDFDVYPVDYTLVDTEVVDGGVMVHWDDGLKSRLPGLWLREFSPDSLTFNVLTREQKIALTDLPKNTRASEVTITPAGFLEVLWLPEELLSRYHPGWLRAHIPGRGASVVTLPACQPWQHGEHEPNWFDGPSVRDGDPETFKHWLEAIRITGVGLLNNLPPEPGIIPEIPEMIGPVRPSNFGKYFEVISRPDANTNAYTALELAPHTDLSTREYMPGLQFLFCLINEASGGASILADGFAIAEQLKAESAEFYEVLSTLSIPFGTKDRNTDHRYRAPVLEHDLHGDLSTVRHTYWLRSPMSGDFDTITTFYAAYRRFQEITIDPANHLSFRLQPGELMAFDNRRILHGRAAFDPSSGRRLLRGCYNEREELESRLRILYRLEASDTGVKSVEQN